MSLPPRADGKKPRLHVSALEALYGCGEKFRRRYIEGQHTKPGTYLVVGRGTHASIQRDLQHKIDTGELLPFDAIADHARDGVVRAWEERGVHLDDQERELGPRKAKAAAIEKAIRLARLHHKELAPRIQPTHVERKWVVELPGPYDLTGVFDIVEAGRIRDTKTASQSPVRSAADESEQLTVYALARWVHDRILPEVVLDHLVALKKKPKVVSQVSTRTKEDLQMQARRIDVATQAIEAGVFVPASPSDWRCSARWCGYFDRCGYARRPASVQVPLSGAA